VLLFTLLAPPASARDYDSSAISSAMAEAMLLMMETMGKIARKRGTGPDGYGDAYTWPPPGWEQIYGMGRRGPRYPPRVARPLVSILEGTWLGNAGDILVVHGVRFRIFIDEEHFTEGIFRIDGNLLAMTNLESRATRIYEYATQEGRLVLRDSDGNLLLY